jgi:hypothetical protein
MQAPVSPGTCSQLPSLQRRRSQNPDPRRWIWKGTAHLFLPSVLTLMGAPRRDGPRKREPGPLMVSVDFQLSVLELVAELLRTAPSFLVIIDQQFLLRDGHKSRAWCGVGLRFVGRGRGRAWWFVGRGPWKWRWSEACGCHGRLHGFGCGHVHARKYALVVSRKSGTSFQMFKSELDN